MVIANVAVVLASAVVFPAITYAALRRLGGAVPSDTINEPRPTPLGVSIVLVFCVLIIFVAGFYATRPFDGVSPFMNMYLPCILVIEIYIRKRTTRSYALFWGLLVVAAIAASVVFWLKHWVLMR